MPPEGARQVRLDSLGPRELQMIQEQLQEELQARPLPAPPTGLLRRIAVLRLPCAGAQGLAQSSLALQKAAGELGTSGQAVQQLAERRPGRCAAACGARQGLRPRTACPTAASAGQTSMIPLTSSLYVEAELDSSAAVLVELGTGYYAEARQPAGSCAGIHAATLFWRSAHVYCHKLQVQQHSQRRLAPDTTPVRRSLFPTEWTTSSER